MSRVISDLDASYLALAARLKHYKPSCKHSGRVRKALADRIIASLSDSFCLEVARHLLKGEKASKEAREAARLLSKWAKARKVLDLKQRIQRPPYPIFPPNC